MNIDDLKELYYREMERKDRLTTMPSVSILVLTILFGACNYYVQHFKFELSPSYFVFLGILALAFICFGLAIHALIRAYIGYNYNALPYASDLHAYYQDLLEYNRYYKIPDSEAQNSYDELIKELLLEANTTNSWNNNSRSDYLYRANSYISFAVVFTLLAGLPVMDREILHVVQPQQVHVTNIDKGSLKIEEVVMAKTPANGSVPSGPEASKPSPPPPKPIPPKMIITKGGEQAPKPKK